MQELSAKELLKNLKFKSEEEIEQQIKLLTTRLEQSTLDLKTEKEILKDLKKLNNDKEEIKKYSTKMSDARKQRHVHEEFFLEKQKKHAEFTEIRDQEKLLMQKIDGIRSGEGTVDGFNAGAKVIELLKDKGQLVDLLKEKRAALQELNTTYRMQLGEYRSRAHLFPHLISLSSGLHVQVRMRCNLCVWCSNDRTGSISGCWLPTSESWAGLRAKSAGQRLLPGPIK